MPERLSKQARSEVMAKIHSRGNRSTEEKFIVKLRQEKITGWRRHATIFGRPDFVFRSARVAVFIDGCFWHGCPLCYRRPQSNTGYWDQKVARNVQRDSLVNETLANKGWRVLRIWEHDLRNENAHRCLKLLKEVLRHVSN